MKKSTSLFLVLVMLLGLFPSLSLAQEQASLEIIYQYSNDSNKAGFEQVIAKFEELHPEITVSRQAIPLSE